MDNKNVLNILKVILFSTIHCSLFSAQLNSNTIVRKNYQLDGFPLKENKKEYLNLHSALNDRELDTLCMMVTSTDINEKDDQGNYFFSSLLKAIRDNREERRNYSICYRKDSPTLNKASEKLYELADFIIRRQDFNIDISPNNSYLHQYIEQVIPLNPLNSESNELFLRLLNKSKAIINKQDSKGDTPLHLYCTKCEYFFRKMSIGTPVSSNNDLLKVIETMLNLGADPNIPNAIGKTAMHSAVIDNGILIILSVYGGDLNHKNNDGEKPIDMEYLPRNNLLKQVDNPETQEKSFNTIVKDIVIESMASTSTKTTVNMPQLIFDRSIKGTFSSQKFTVVPAIMAYILKLKETNNVEEEDREEIINALIPNNHLNAIGYITLSFSIQ